MSAERSLLVASIAFAAALLGGMSGGSASALSTPAWLALGFPLPTAVAADKVAGALWTLFGARNYLRRRTVDRRLLLAMVPLGVAGAWFGARLTSVLDPALLTRAVGGLILLLIAVMLARPRIGVVEGPSRLSRAATAAWAVPLGFYEGMLGSGNSLVATLLLCAGRGFDLIAALGHYYVLAFFWCALAAISYITHGHGDPGLTIPATLGACAGGYLGSRIASRRESRFVRVLFLIVGSLLGLKLVFGL